MNTVDKKPTEKICMKEREQKEKNTDFEGTGTDIFELHKTQPAEIKEKKMKRNNNVFYFALALIFAISAAKGIGNSLALG